MRLSVAPLGVPRFVKFSVVQLLDHVKIFSNLKSVSVAPSASGFSRTLFLSLVLREVLDVHAYMYTRCFV